MKIIGDDGSIIEHLVRDEATGAIIVRQSDKLTTYMKTKKVLLEKDQRINKLEHELADLRQLVYSLIEKQ